MQGVSTHRNPPATGVQNCRLDAAATSTSRRTPYMLTPWAPCNLPNWGHSAPDLYRSPKASLLGPGTCMLLRDARCISEIWQHAVTFADVVTNFGKGATATCINTAVRNVGGLLNILCLFNANRMAFAGRDACFPWCLCAHPQHGKMRECSIANWAVPAEKFKARSTVLGKESHVARVLECLWPTTIQSLRYKSRGV